MSKPDSSSTRQREQLTSLEGERGADPVVRSREHPVSPHAPGETETRWKEQNALVRSLAELGGVDREAERGLDARADC